jgi:hypothetical protein
MLSRLLSIDALTHSIVSTRIEIGWRSRGTGLSELGRCQPSIGGLKLPRLPWALQQIIVATVAVGREGTHIELIIFLTANSLPMIQISYPDDQDELYM